MDEDRFALVLFHHDWLSKGYIIATICTYYHIIIIIDKNDKKKGKLFGATGMDGGWFDYYEDNYNRIP